MYICTDMYIPIYEYTYLYIYTYMYIFVDIYKYTHPPSVCVWRSYTIHTCHKCVYIYTKYVKKKSRSLKILAATRICTYIYT